MLRYLINPPNIITSASLFCGFYSMVLASRAGGDPYQLYLSGLFIMLAAVFDGLDGRVARWTGTASDFGVQYDSLSDVISFGVAPAFLLYQWTLSELGNVGLVACFAFAMCGAMRLARFNITTSIIPKGFSQGLTITQSAGMLAAAVVFNYRVLDGQVHNPRLVLAAVVGFSLLMISSVWFRTFKDLKMNRWGMSLVGGILLSMAVLWFRTHEFAWIFVVYPTLHVASGLLEDVLRYARGRTHSQLIAEYQAAQALEDAEDEVEELVHQ